ncbi:hypothetical protein CRYUN_Cryun38cG0040500 [Craigia yunnanensis]
MSYFVKDLTKVDVNKQMAIPTNFIEHLPRYQGREMIYISVHVVSGNVWERFRNYINQDYPKPVFQGDWRKYVRAKHLTPGDKIIFRVEENADGVPRYTIAAQRRIVVFGTIVAMPYFVKDLTKVDVNKQMAIPTNFIEHLPCYQGRETIYIPVHDVSGNVWERFRYYINQDYPKPVFQGDWRKYVHAKHLTPGDKIIFRVEENADGVPRYTITAQRRIVVFGTIVAMPYFVKDLTKVDVNKQMAIPTNFIEHLPHYQGDWRKYVRAKHLTPGDKIIFRVEENADGVPRHNCSTKKDSGFWYDRSFDYAFISVVVVVCQFHL